MRRDLPAACSRVLAVAVVAALLGVPGGAEMAEPFAVNVYTPDGQSAPALAAGAGVFVVVWESEGQDGDQLGVFARAFDPGGVALGDELQINQTWVASQASPAVAAAADGFVVVWEDYDPLAFEDAIFARRLDADAEPTGSEFRVDRSISSYHLAPAVSAAGDGRFAVVWDDYDDVFGQIVDADGALIGDEFRVNAEADGYQALASVAVLDGGDFVVAWTDGSYYGGRDGDGYGIFARRFSSNGVAMGGDFQVNDDGSGDQVAPVVVAAASGGFAVAWESYDQIAAQGQVSARRFDSAGAPLGADLIVSGGDAYYPGEVAATARGDEMMVVWSDLQPTLELGVVARRYSADGVPLREPLPIAPLSGLDQFAPAVALLADGRVAVAWETDGADGDGTSIAAVVDRAGTGSATPAPTATPSPSPTAASSSTQTAAAAATPTSPSTATAPPPSSTPPPTATRTPTPTATRTPTPSASATRTRTSTPTATRTASDSPTRSETATPTPSRTATPTASETATEEATPTHTVAAPMTPTQTGVHSSTQTPVASSSPTPSPPTAQAGTPTDTATPQSTAPSTATPDSTATDTATPESTATGTTAAQSTATDTATPADTATPRPTATGTATAIDTATARSTATDTATPESTATRPASTFTPSPLPCSGDCDGDAQVSVADLVLAVNAALGRVPTARCAAADRDADGEIGIAELIRAVARALDGCA